MNLPNQKNIRNCGMRVAWLSMTATAMAETTSGPADARNQGGLCVVVGSGDGSLAMTLAGKPSMAVNVLEPDARKVEALCKALVAAKSYGRCLFGRQGRLHGTVNQARRNKNPWKTPTTDC